MRKYLIYNLMFLPLHLFLYLCLFIGILLTGDADDFIMPVAAVTAQLYILGLIPNIIYAIRHRKEHWSLSGLLITLPILVGVYNYSVNHESFLSWLTP